MALEPKPYLVNLLRCACQDAMFVLASSQAVSESDLEAVYKRRAAAYEAVGKGGPVDADDWRTWTATMSAVMAPVHSPSWLPMQELVQSVSLEAGARGVRSLFTSKPSEKEVQRTRKVGALAVRALASVQGADGDFTEDEQLLRSCLVAALGLPDEDVRMLEAEKPIPPQALEIYGEIEPKVAKALVRGTWLGAFSDGIDPREDEAVQNLAKKVGLTPEDTEALRQEVRAQVDARKAFGMACVDAVRYVLSDEPQAAQRLGRLTATVALPQVHRAESLASVDGAGPVILAKRHTLDRSEREACLTLAWFAALSVDPSTARAAELIVRHDRLAADLGGRAEGAAARVLAESMVEKELTASAGAAGL